MSRTSNTPTQGYASAQSILGGMYLSGEFVLARDTARGVEWLKKAAAEGNADGQVQLGKLYDEGEFVLEDYLEAVKWYRKAADQGDDLGQMLLGLMHAEGKGVPQDLVKAYMWPSLAAASGNEDARNAREIVMEEMTPEQIAEGQRLAREWLEAHPQKED